MEKRTITTDLVCRFEQGLYADEKSNATVEKYMRDIFHLRTFLNGSEVNKASMLAYKSHLQKGYAIASANSMLAAANAFLRFAGWHDCCVKRFKVQHSPFYPAEKELTKEEYLQLIRTAEKQGNVRLALLLQTLCSTGIRVSELEFITVDAVIKGEVTVTCKAKTRRVFLVSALRKKLMHYIRSRKICSGSVFVTRNGKCLHRSNIWREMKRLCLQAGVSAQKVFPHNLRHLFARTFYELEKDIAKLADILGHSGIDTTRIYIATSGHEHRRRMETLHLIL